MPWAAFGIISSCLALGDRKSSFDASAKARNCKTNANQMKLGVRTKQNYPALRSCDFFVTRTRIHYFILFFIPFAIGCLVLARQSSKTQTCR